MRTILFSLFLLGSLGLFAQETSLPAIDLKDLNGRTVNASTIHNDGQPMIVSFWAIWCKPCLKELTTINEYILDWEAETGVKLVAISIDDTRSSAKVRSIALGNSWEYDVYIDENSEFKRAMNVVNIPHTFLFNGKGEMVYQHNSYAPGDEDILYEKLLEISEAE
jgi:cytochrome c biogenesis protein CcmG, thiol:disulfide interchange protein DsbE